MSQKFIKNIQQILTKKHQIVNDLQALETYNLDYTKTEKGNGQFILYPENTLQVSQILEICDKENQPIITCGGLTSLVAGTLAQNKEVYLSLQKMKNFSFNQNTQILTAESGAILQTVQEHINQYGYDTPYNLGARGSCTIGGNVATCAGGINFLKYGSLRNYILGLEVVLSDGKILDLTSEVQKNNTGIDMKHLFIGSEGQLGIITKIQMLCKPKPKFSKLFLFKIKDFKNIQNAIIKAKYIFLENLIAMEYMDYETFSLAHKFMPSFIPKEFEVEDIEQYRQKCTKIDENDKEHFLLLEVLGDNENDVMNQMDKYYQEIKQGMIDSIMAENQTQYTNLWEFRENMSNTQIRYGKCLKFDVSLSVKDCYELIRLTRQKFQHDSKLVAGYGHFGDGNIHLQVILEKDTQDPELIKEIKEFVYKWVCDHKGSISAEHGVGIIKKQYLKMQKSELEMQIAQKMKKLFDPKNILNPQKTLYQLCKIKT